MFLKINKVEDGNFDPPRGCYSLHGCDGYINLDGTSVWVRSLTSYEAEDSEVPPSLNADILVKALAVAQKPDLIVDILNAEK